ncbi:hypothetical protein SmJEL517_g05096 [Synchytrium microbalum]|uniref:Histone chaperone RTT106/FACT complex subunit SPT16-like middle domain-containing protein n=1 Tax=Synchytrium microbalum TaxID=1806994 RepID=A0A507BXL3_9FUNG|nr:uncharacterized protein SmJEL517_g05096 [Synchytrium microbalum]TPX31589.1 hypothetical protein SmJEL517_g05096 [Synchytrium microbalum]
MMTSAEQEFDEFKTLVTQLNDNELEADVNAYIKKNGGEAKSILERVLRKLIPSQPTSAANKKRKLDDQVAALPDDKPILATIHDVSVVSPIRKKCDVSITETTISFCNKDKIEFTMAISSITHILCLQTPEKQKAHWTFVLIGLPEAIAFGLEDKGGVEKGGGVKISKGSEVTVVEKVNSNKEPVIELLEALVAKKSSGSAKAIQSNEKDFKSVANKGKPYVGANIGSRQGVMYCLREGIFHGFRKPMLFIPMNQIQTVGVSSVVQHTFSLTVDQIRGDDTVQHEFSYISTVEYDNVSTFLAKFKSLWNTTPIVKAKEEQSKADGTSAADDEAGPVAEKAIDESDEDDEDFEMDSDDDEVGEEYDSDHDSEAGANTSGTAADAEEELGSVDTAEEDEENGDDEDEEEQEGEEKSDSEDAVAQDKMDVDKTAEAEYTLNVNLNDVRLEVKARYLVKASISTKGSIPSLNDVSSDAQQTDVSKIASTKPTFNTSAFHFPLSGSPPLYLDTSELSLTCFRVDDAVDSEPVIVGEASLPLTDTYEYLVAGKLTKSVKFIGSKLVNIKKNNGQRVSYVIGEATIVLNIERHISSGLSYSNLERGASAVRGNSAGVAVDHQGVIGSTSFGSRLDMKPGRQFTVNGSLDALRDSLSRDEPQIQPAARQISALTDDLRPIRKESSPRLPRNLSANHQNPPSTTSPSQRDITYYQNTIDRLLQELNSRTDALKRVGADLVAGREIQAKLESKIRELRKRIAESDGQTAMLMDMMDLDVLSAEELRKRYTILCKKLKQEKAYSRDMVERLEVVQNVAIEKNELEKSFLEIRQAHTAQAAYVLALQETVEEGAKATSLAKKQEAMIKKLQRDLSDQQRLVKESGRRHAESAEFPRRYVELESLRRQGGETNEISRALSNENQELKQRLLDMENRIKFLSEPKEDRARDQRVVHQADPELANLRMELVNELREEVARENRRADDAERELRDYRLECERAIQSEKARADRAESHAQALNAEVIDFARQFAVLKGELKKKGQALRTLRERIAVVESISSSPVSSRAPTPQQSRSTTELRGTGSQRILDRI